MTSQDKKLGLDVPITRRDFVGATLIGSGSGLLAGCSPASLLSTTDGTDPWTGYGGVGDYSSSNGNTAAVRDAAHRLRDRSGAEIASSALATGEVFDTVIVGGGFSGLGAAFQFQEQSGDGKTSLILDNHPIFGGEAKENEFQVDGYRLFGPQGSNGFVAPTGHTTLSDDVWRQVGMPLTYEFAAADGIDSAPRIPFDSYDAMFWGESHFDVGHYFGRESGTAGWVRNIWADDLARTPWPENIRADLRRAYQGRERFHGDEGLGPWLDSMSYGHYLEQVMGLDETVTRTIDPVVAVANFGCSSDVISAYCGYLLALPGMKGYQAADTIDFEQAVSMSFPGGNTTYARHLVKHLIPAAIAGDKNFEDIAFRKVNFSALDRPGNQTRLRLGSQVVDVRHTADSGSVRVSYLRNGQVEQIRARSCVMATGGWVAQRVAADMPAQIRESYTQIHHAPVLVVNVALRNWRFLARLGIGAARWYDGFGFFGSIRAPMQVGAATAPFHPDKPIVMTFYVPFPSAGHDIQTQGALGRAQLMNKSYRDYEIIVREKMNDLFASAGFDARRDIAGIILNRWGHAFNVPQPGFYFGGGDGKGLAAPIREGYGRVFFGHSELGTRMNYRNAIGEGGRAGEQAAALG